MADDASGLTASEALAQLATLHHDICDKAANLASAPTYSRDTRFSRGGRAYAGVQKSYAPRGSTISYRGRARGGRAGRYSQTLFRNRSLVVNSSSSGQDTPTDSLDGESKPADWVSISGRTNKQLINSKVHQKIQASKAKHAHEKTILKGSAPAFTPNAYSQRPHANNDNTSSSTHPSSTEIDVNGFKFRVIDGGSKLIRISGQSSSVRAAGLAHFADGPNIARLIPAKHEIAGVTFLRSKHGNLYRSDIVKSTKSVDRGLNSLALQTDALRSPKRSRLCATFTTSGTTEYFARRFRPIVLVHPLEKDLFADLLIGSCSKGSNCQFTHDPNKLTICKTFLQKGHCPNGDYCNLSHTLSPHVVPACVHFLRGHCTNQQCRYSHTKVAPGADVCRDFALLGYCEKGADCAERHVNECPDYANAGKCPNKRCHLPHVDTAARLRKLQAQQEEKESAIDSEEEFFADDVDSDEDLVVQGAPGADVEAVENRDFIRI